ncbi:CRISPR type III-B/RAMP module RAMP protein Cmr1 [Saprospira grandis DSM 2844]|uniref:CRISPR type III-B/RAMP module RAMP protein Cmr1 n=1 Tax=Saprospira grandis DSM 2844 TaxID=694433 RepID=J0P4B1_9BACT|nr:type III-B CRISPR module RAMP protein Cmr1 [Saprospira grandis]EJF54684.1 CRISPR type III-B/RAMP module RAMP protein Cmr1 [Saprospira grandis DSM 2844]
MHRITFECETITPMFMAGADGKTPELRAPSIKGALRFWWRALNGHLELEELKEREKALFGSTAGKSAFLLRASLIGDEKIASYKMLPHRERSFRAEAFSPRQKFTVTISARDEKVFSSIKKVFLFLSIAGGLGKRARRGFGSFFVENQGYSLLTLEDVWGICFSDAEWEQEFTFNRNYAEEIVKKNKGKAAYGFLKKITFGFPDRLALKKIGQSTHDLKHEYKWDYANIMGSGKPRFASPMYTSVSKEFAPVITELACFPERGTVDLYLKREVFDNYRKDVL